MERQDFEGHLKPILELAFRYAVRLSGSHDDAKDLLQEATLDAWKGREQFQSGTNFKAWFFRILTNRFYRIRQKKEISTVAIDDAPDAFLYQQAKNSGISVTGDDPAADLFSQIESESVREALDELPSEFREVSLLYFLGDMSYEEIAATVSVPIGTVRSRLHRGRKLLQVRLWDIAKERGLVAGDALG